MNVVFDFGGVLFRWQPHDFFPRVLPHLAGTEAAAQALVSAFFEGYAGDWAEYDRGAVDEARLANRIAFRTGLDIADVQRVLDAIPGELVLLPHTESLLARLRARGHRLFFLSNMPLRYAAHLESLHPLHDWFDDGLFSSRIGRVKPEPAIFEHAARHFGIAPKASVFIDDFALNVKAARALGWEGIHFLSAAQCEGEFVRRGWL